MKIEMDNYRWIIESTIEALIASETYLVLPNIVFVSEPNEDDDYDGKRGAFLRYEDNKADHRRLPGRRWRLPAPVPGHNRCGQGEQRPHHRSTTRRIT